MSVAYYNFTDPRDGKIYPCVQMPDGKWWFAKNLSYATPNSQVYNNDSANEAIYGRLYPWTDITDVCPSGCHIPTDAEWTALTTAIGEDVASTKLKANSSLWITNTGTDDYGFSALPAGDHYNDGTFNYLGYYAYFWSSSEYDASNALGRSFSHDYAYGYRNCAPKSIGFSLRCIVDEVSVASPTVTPPSGAYIDGTEVTITASAGASIYYTLDGTEPTAASPVYLAPFRLTSSATVKAKAYVGGIPSDTTTAILTILTPAPSIYPSSGTFQGVQLVTLKSSQSLPIRYTLDGSEPTISSPLYISPIPVNHDTQIKASAFVGTIYSSTMSASYKITNGILNRIPNYRDHVLPYLLEQYKGDNA